MFRELRAFVIFVADARHGLPRCASRLPERFEELWQQEVWKPLPPTAMISLSALRAGRSAWGAGRVVLPRRTASPTTLVRRWRRRGTGDVYGSDHSCAGRIVIRERAGCWKSVRVLATWRDCARAERAAVGNNRMRAGVLVRPHDGRTDRDIDWIRRESTAVDRGVNGRGRGRNGRAG